MIPEGAKARLQRAEWLRRPEVQAIFALLDGAEGRTRAVGGIVRDTILNRMRADPEVDLATELTPDEVTRRAEAAGVPVYPTGIEHGTVTLKVGEQLAEVTTLREDVETDGRHAVVRFGTDWRRDAERRDFTLNALYVDADGTLLDPVGGADDCLAGRVRFIGAPDRRIDEDRLRVYRFFRFTASHGGEHFDEDGLAACARASGSLGAVSAERVGAEMRRMLDLPQVVRTLAAMDAAGVQPFSGDLLGRFAHYETHAARPAYRSRLALLMTEREPDALQDQWRLSNDDVAGAETVLKTGRLLAAYRINEAAYRHPAVLAEALDVAATLGNWTAAGKSAVVEQLQGLDLRPFPLKGNDLIAAGIRPGPALGAELSRLESLWIASGFALDREELLAELRS